MNISISSLNFTKRHHKKIKRNNKAELPQKQEVKPMTPLKTDTFQTTLKPNCEFVLYPYHVEQTVPMIKKTAQFGLNEASKVLHNSKKQQELAGKLYEKFLEKFSFRKSKAAFLKEEKRNTIFRIGFDNAIYDVSIKNGECVARTRNNDRCDEKVREDIYKLDLKTGELLYCAIGKTTYKDGAYCADAEYFYEDNELASCDLNVANKNFKLVQKSLFFQKDKLKEFLLVAKEEDEQMHVAKRFSYLNDKLQKYDGDFCIKTGGVITSKFRYEFDELTNELKYFTGNYEQRGADEVYWDVISVFS